jgi:hypothetical protein
MPEQSPRPMNKLAETLLARLAELGAPARAGYFAGSTYCLGVYFRDDGAAAYLGFRLGEGWGRSTSMFGPMVGNSLSFATPLYRRDSMSKTLPLPLKSKRTKRRKKLGLFIDLASKQLCQHRCSFT